MGAIGRRLWRQLWHWATARVLGVTLLAAIGVLQVGDYVLGTFLDAGQGDQSKTVFDFIPGNFLWPFLITVVLVITCRKRWPRMKFAAKVPDTDSWIHVEVGDLFAGEGAVIIPVNTTFDTSVERAGLSKDNIVVQFVDRGYMSQSVLENEIGRQLENTRFTELADGRSGNTRQYPIGTIVALHADNRHFFLLAILQTNEHGQASAIEDEVIEAIIALWNYLAERGGVRGTVRMPVVGAGSRLRLDTETQIENQISQFLAASAGLSLGLDLTCVIWPKDWTKKRIDLDRIEQFVTVGLRRFRLSASAPTNSGTAEETAQS